MTEVTRPDPSEDLAPPPSPLLTNPADRVGVLGRVLAVFGVTAIGGLLFALFCVGAAYTALGQTFQVPFYPEYFALAVLTVSYAGLLVAIVRPQQRWSWLLCLVVGAALAQVPPLAWAEQLEAWRSGGSVADVRPFANAFHQGVTEGWFPYARATFLALCVVPVFLWSWLVQRRGGEGWVALMAASPVLICAAALASSQWAHYLQLGEALVGLAPTLVFSLWLVLSLYLVRAWHAARPAYRSEAWSPRLAVREARKQVQTRKLRYRIGWRHAHPLRRFLTLLAVATAGALIHEAAAPHLYVAKHHKGWLELGRVLSVALSLTAAGAFVAFARPKRSWAWVGCALLGLTFALTIEQAWLARSFQLHQGLPATDFDAAVEGLRYYHGTLSSVHQGRYLALLLTPLTTALTVFLWVWLVGRRRFGAWLLVLFLLPMLIPTVELVLYANGLWGQDSGGLGGIMAFWLGQRTPGLTQLFPGFALGLVLVSGLWIQRLKDRVYAAEEAQRALAPEEPSPLPREVAGAGAQT